MARAQKTIAMLATVTVAIGALGGPVAAAKTKLTIVNGTPGKKLDVCVNGREIRSGLKYGGFVKKTIRKPKAMVKFYPRRKGACRGALLGKRLVKPPRAVVVRTKKKDPGRVLMFREPSLPKPSAVTAYDVIVNGLNASELDKIWFGVKLAIPIDTGPAMASLDKGQQMRVFADQIGDTQREVQRTVFQNPEQVVDGPELVTVRGFRYIQWLVLGTSLEDVNVVSFGRKIGLVEEQP